MSGEDEPERRPLPLARIDLDVALVIGGDVADDGQPQSGAPAVAAATLVHPVEPLEDAVEIPSRDADTVGFHVQLDLSVRHRRHEPDRPSVVAELPGVLEEVVEG